ncbi:hypothetical protein, conserved [Trypanosoma brucei brucei TREU927]|uniref:Uncharacterized protein n=2 Tax=Trypanosoma brucei TaxID=5691 RepID=D6XGH3_TRYB2|nr:hypothetical protein, conserved [Trypanosoma brucei brucei TREU927]AAP70476.1 GntB [Trypanosoma brucei rhodesiense]AAX80439.1 hypothetical protein, conserved [Trypanosoma brucei]AAZ11350.1 hypothetical protein, conserved [Trypanosoma brucei brucei TREU927]
MERGGKIAAIFVGHFVSRRHKVFLFLFSLLFFFTSVMLLSSCFLLSTPSFFSTGTSEGSSISRGIVSFSSGELPSSNVAADTATIFVSLASFRDSECVTTLDRLFSAAKNPHRVFVGISEERFGSESGCTNSPTLLGFVGSQRDFNIRWRDVVPRAFDEATSDEFRPPPTTPLLHARRENDVLTCFLKPKISRPSPLPQGKELLRNCQVVTRVGDPDDARGPTYARYITSLFYVDQDYYMVIDSHIRALLEWDEKMIKHARLMPTRGVLSHYPNGYTPQNPDKEVNYTHVMAMCKAVIPPTNIPKLGARWILKRQRPLLQSLVAAGYIFGDAQFVKDVPFDPYLPYLFEGEEMLYTARLWTNGWDSYCPGDSFVFHNYERASAPRFWSAIYKSNQSESRKRQEKIGVLRALYLMERKELNTTVPLVSRDVAQIVCPAISIEEGRFGMGTVRPLDAFWEFAELTDAFLKEKDDEGRWMGGEGLCHQLEALSASIKHMASED